MLKIKDKEKSSNFISTLITKYLKENKDSIKNNTIFRNKLTKEVKDTYIENC